MGTAVPHLSASRISLYLQCPRKYAFRYVDCVVVPWKSVNLAFGFRRPWSPPDLPRKAHGGPEAHGG